MIRLASESNQEAVVLSESIQGAVIHLAGKSIQGAVIWLGTESNQEAAVLLGTRSIQGAVIRLRTEIVQGVVILREPLICQETEIMQKALNYKGAEIPPGEENLQEARNAINMEVIITIMQEHPMMAPAVLQTITFGKTQDSVPLRLKEEVPC